MKRDPALDRFCDLDDFRLLMLDRTFPTKSFARTYGRLDLAHRAPPTLSVSPECAAIHHRESLLKLAANPACVVCLRGIGKENGHWHTPLRLRPPRAENA